MLKKYVGANPPEGVPTYNFAKFPPKLHEIERIWTLGGISYPLRSTTGLCTVTSLTFVCFVSFLNDNRTQSSGLVQMYDLKNENEAKEYLEKLGTEYSFQACKCFEMNII